MLESPVDQLMPLLHRSPPKSHPPHPHPLTHPHGWPPQRTVPNFPVALGSGTSNENAPSGSNCIDTGRRRRSGPS